MSKAAAAIIRGLFRLLTDVKAASAKLRALSRSKGWVPVTLIVVLIAIVTGVEYYVEHATFAEDRVSSLSELQDRQLDVFLQSTVLLSTLATLVLAAGGSVILGRYGSTAVPPAQRTAFIVIAVLGGLGLYSAYLALRMTQFMLGAEFYNLSWSLVRWPARLQFAFCLGAVLGLLYLVLGAFNRDGAG